MAPAIDQQTISKLPAPNREKPLLSADDVTVLFVLGGPGAGKGTQCERLVKDYGFKKKKEQWVFALEKPYNITLDNPGSNKNVCTITIDYAQTPEQAQELANALHDYATWENSPQLRLIRNDQTVGSDFRRFTVSWDDAWAGGHAGLVFMRLKKLDETSVGKNFERAQILYSTNSR